MLTLAVAKETRHCAAIISRLLTLFAMFSTAGVSGAEETSDAAEYFESHVRPVLVEKCVGCHGPDDQSSDLRLDSLPAMLRGGQQGAAIIPGNAERSLLIRALKQDGDLRMPPKPDSKLDEQVIDRFSRWINAGAVWPDAPATSQATPAEKAVTHWAFQPISRPAIPPSTPHAQSQANDVSAALHTPIDAFVSQKLNAAGLRLAHETDRRTLIRRVYYTLTGLPPTPQDVATFVADPDPAAYEKLVDQLLDSPHYAEHWARHWLDVARYSDTKGYVYAREERFWIHAWLYRDWVVQALQQDLPYDRFLLLQLAADLVSDTKRGDLAALGYLTLGRRFLGVKHDVIDDRIDVVCRGTMALTVGCARCHDHKYDPIGMDDYYGLYGVFDSCAEHRVDLAEGEASAPDAEFYEGLKERQEKLAVESARYSREAADRVRARLYDYLHAQTILDSYPAEGFDQILTPDDIYPAFVRQWESYLRTTLNTNDPIFGPWHDFQRLPAAEFESLAMEVTVRWRSVPVDRVNARVLQCLDTPPKSFDDVVRRYADMLGDVDRRWKARQAAAAGDGPDGAEWTADDEALLGVLYGERSPCEVPEGTIVTTETFYPTNQCEQLWRLQGDVDRWIMSAGESARFALTLVDRQAAREPRIFRRGNAARKGNEVERRAPRLLSTFAAEPFSHGSGRLELARAIIDPANPLTARVIVNRVWAGHFGQGLVRTTSDFGTRAAPPTHPELLDWLASEFVQNGWSLKQLHRMIVMSATFRQVSESDLDESYYQRAKQLDPENELLWHAPRHRLTFEEMRDTLLSITGELDRAVGGKPRDMFSIPSMPRRAIYGLVDRQFLPATLRTFDFANPDLHTPTRSETTVPQQNLFFMNHPFLLERAQSLAAQTAQSHSVEQRITQMFHLALLRDPSSDELHDAIEWLAAAEHEPEPQRPPTVADWQYGFGRLESEQQRVGGFTPLPHFSGKAWQGSDKYPDDKLGWVQLSAEGGHPGNDLEHAAVRRWITPRDLTIEIRSTIAHTSEPGDGIRAFVVSSRQGVLHTQSLHQKSEELNCDPLELQTGDTIDFVVDIGEVLNSDDFRWEVTITEVVPETASSSPATIWNSKVDFTQNVAVRLTPWEQFAQVLLCTNEVMFVD
jgi:cytochrome c553